MITPITWTLSRRLTLASTNASTTTPDHSNTIDNRTKSIGSDSLETFVSSLGNFFGFSKKKDQETRLLIDPKKTKF